MSVIKKIIESDASELSVVAKNVVLATTPGRKFTLPSLDGRVRKELSGKLDDLFKGVEGHPNQMIVLTGLVYELILLLDEAGIVSVDEFSHRFVKALAGDPKDFNVAHAMGQRGFRGLGNELL